MWQTGRESYWVNCIPSAIAYSPLRPECSAMEYETEKKKLNDVARMNERDWMDGWRYDNNENWTQKKRINSSRSVYILWMQWMQYNFFISVSSLAPFAIHSFFSWDAVPLRFNSYFIFCCPLSAFNLAHLVFISSFYRFEWVFSFSFSSFCSSFSRRICFVCS